MRAPVLDPSGSVTAALHTKSAGATRPTYSGVLTRPSSPSSRVGLNSAWISGPSPSESIAHLTPLAVMLEARIVGDLRTVNVASKEDAIIVATPGGVQQSGGGVAATTGDCDAAAGEGRTAYSPVRMTVGSAAADARAEMRRSAKAFVLTRQRSMSSKAVPTPAPAAPLLLPPPPSMKVAPGEGGDAERGGSEDGDPASHSLSAGRVLAVEGAGALVKTATDGRCVAAFARRAQQCWRRAQRYAAGRKSPPSQSEAGCISAMLD